VNGCQKEVRLRGPAGSAILPRNFPGSWPFPACGLVLAFSHGGNLDMKKIAWIAVIVFGASLASDAAQAGCYRMGETGYHHYRSCVGPGFLYPHHRRCHRHHRGCWYH
jgi:hypothetical protein